MTPEGWAERALADIASVVSGAGFPRAHQGNRAGSIPFFKVSDMNTPGNERDLRVAANTVDMALLNSLNGTLHPVGTVVFPKVGAALLTNKRRRLVMPSCFDNNVMGLVATACLPDYLHLLMQIVDFRKHVQQGAVPSINSSTIGRILVLVPTIPEQRKIASILSSVDEAIEKTRAVIDQVQMVRRGLMQRLLTQGMPNRHDRYKKTGLGIRPESWKVVSLGDIAAVKGGKRMPKGRRFADSVTPYPYIRVCDFTDGTVDSSRIKYVLPEDREQIRRYTISRDDVYISIAGTLGRVGTVPPELDGAQLTENAAKIVLKDTRSSGRDFIKIALESDECQAQLTRLRGVGGGVPKLALFRIQQVRLPLPAITEQREIVGILESIRDYYKTLSAELDAAQQLKSALMSVLLTGELRVTPDPEPE